MNIRHLLKCPDINLQKAERIKALENTIADWIYSEAFVRLIIMFGGSVLKNGSIKDQIEHYNSFADAWDYRKKKTNGRERWLVTEDQFITEHKASIMECMYLLGLTEVAEPIQQPDYVLPLGGARMANLDRCLAANDVCQKYQSESIPVVALTGMRPIDDIEKTALERYAPEAKTEYDAMCGGIEKAFSLSGCSYYEKINSNENENLTWAERIYQCDERDISVLAAPSSDPNRRANSMDTFEFFMKRYDPNFSWKILLITSPIYVPYQVMRFTDLALEMGGYVECIGNKSYDQSPSELNTASYLQEFKAAINAINALAVKYF